ncbi:hypothetical protein RhiirA4_417079, partial [Rhizophagus irregularis]
EEENYYCCAWSIDPNVGAPLLAVTGATGIIKILNTKCKIGYKEKSRVFGNEKGKSCKKKGSTSVVNKKISDNTDALVNGSSYKDVGNKAIGNDAIDDYMNEKLCDNVVVKQWKCATRTAIF